jgi:hypothetical protein
MRYDEFVAVVLSQIVTGHDPGRFFTYAHLIDGLALGANPWGDHTDALRKAKQMALVHACDDLESQDLIATSTQMIAPTLRGKKLVERSILDIYPSLRVGDLNTNEERFLQEVHRQSAVEHEGWAAVEETTSQRVFEALGWMWDRQRSIDILNVTDTYEFTRSRTYGGGEHQVRIRWAGVVKIADDAGRALEEARAHLEAGHLRAAGVVAAVELERRLWDLGVRPKPSKGRDPGLHDYRLAARAAQVIDQQTDTEIETLAVIRKRCAHFNEREPTPDEVKQLVDGVDRILRRFPVLQ